MLPKDAFGFVRKLRLFFRFQVLYHDVFEIVVVDVLDSISSTCLICLVLGTKMNIQLEFKNEVLFPFPDVDLGLHYQLFTSALSKDTLVEMILMPASLISIANSFSSTNDLATGV